MSIIFIKMFFLPPVSRIHLGRRRAQRSTSSGRTRLLPYGPPPSKSLFPKKKAKTCYKVVRAHPHSSLFKGPATSCIVGKSQKKVFLKGRPLRKK